VAGLFAGREIKKLAKPACEVHLAWRKKGIKGKKGTKTRLPLHILSMQTQRLGLRCSWESEGGALVMRWDDTAWEEGCGGEFEPEEDSGPVSS
jgi:hypothetical protein